MWSGQVWSYLYLVETALQIKIGIVSAWPVSLDMIISHVIIAMLSPPL